MRYANDTQSIYCYKGTDILINKFDIRNQDILDKIEADITRKNIAVMNLKPVKGRFDLKHLQNIHTTIFKDIYPFAGQIRSEIIVKGNTTFALPQYISEYANILFKKLKKDNFLIDSSLDKFSQEAAYYMAEINAIHPFREGNGRSNREFIRLLALQCGFYINWNKVSRDEFLHASIKSIYNTKELEKLIKDTIVNIKPLYLGTSQ